MATDWIKMRTDLYRDPKVCMIADFLGNPDGELAAHVSQNCQREMTITRNALRNVTVGALVTVWGVTRHRGKRIGDDLFVKNISLSVLDDIAEVPGFGAALATVGWAVESSQGVAFPRFFEEFNVEPNAESTAKNAERQRRYRDKKRNALRNVTVTQRSNGEKRREENKNRGVNSLLFESLKDQIPEELRTESFSGVWDSWVKHREEIKKPLKPTQVKSQLAMLGKLGQAKAIAMIEYTIAKGWQGLAEPDAKSVHHVRQEIEF